MSIRRCYNCGKDTEYVGLGVGDRWFCSKDCQDFRMTVMGMESQIEREMERYKNGKPSRVKYAEQVLEDFLTRKWSTKS